MSGKRKPKSQKKSKTRNQNGRPRSPSSNQDHSRGPVVNITITTESGTPTISSRTVSYRSHDLGASGGSAGSTAITSSNTSLATSISQRTAPTSTTSITSAATNPMSGSSARPTAPASISLKPLTAASFIEASASMDPSKKNVFEDFSDATGQAYDSIGGARRRIYLVSSKQTRKRPSPPPSPTLSPILGPSPTKFERNYIVNDESDTDDERNESALGKAEAKIRARVGGLHQLIDQYSRQLRIIRRHQSRTNSNSRLGPIPGNITEASNRPEHKITYDESSKLIQIKLNAAAAIARKLYNNYSFLFKSYDSNDEVSVEEKRLDCESMLITVDALNEVFVRIGMEDIKTELEALAERIMALTEILKYDDSQDVRNQLFAAKMRYLKYRKHAHYKINGSRWIEILDQALKNLLTEDDQLSYEIQDFVLYEENQKSETLRDLEAADGIIDLDEYGLSSLDREITRIATSGNIKAEIEDLIECNAETLRPDLSTVPQVDGNSAEKNNTDDTSGSNHDPNENENTGNQNNGNRTDDFFVVSGDANYEENLRPLGDLTKPHPLITISEYKLGVRSIILYICKCGYLYGSRQRAIDHAENCHLQYQPVNVNACKIAGDIAASDSEEPMEVDRTSIVTEVMPTPVSDQPSTDAPPKKPCKKYTASKTTSSRPKPRSSSFKGSYNESNQDNEEDDPRPLPEVITISSASSQEELEVVFENVGQDSGVEEPIQSSNDEDVSNNVQTENQIGENNEGRNANGGRNPNQTSNAERTERPRPFDLVEISEDQFNALLPNSDARHRIENLKRFKVRDNVEIIMNRDDLRTDLNGRAERIRELEPSDLRNGLTNRRRSVNGVKTRAISLVTDVFNNEPDYGFICAASEDLQNIQAFLEEEIHRRSINPNTEDTDNDDLEEILSMVRTASLLCMHRKKHKHIGDNFDQITKKSLEDELTAYLKKLKNQRDALLHLNEQLKANKKARDEQEKAAASEALKRMAKKREEECEKEFRRIVKDQEEIDQAKAAFREAAKAANLSSLYQPEAEENAPLPHNFTLRHDDLRHDLTARRTSVDRAQGAEDLENRQPQRQPQQDLRKQLNKGKGKAIQKQAERPPRPRPRYASGRSSTSESDPEVQETVHQSRITAAIENERRFNQQAGNGTGNPSGNAAENVAGSSRGRPRATVQPQPLAEVLNRVLKERDDQQNDEDGASFASSLPGLEPQTPQPQREAHERYVSNQVQRDTYLKLLEGIISRKMEEAETSRRSSNPGGSAEAGNGNTNLHHPWQTSGRDAPYLTCIVDSNGKIVSKIVNYEAQDTKTAQYVSDKLWKQRADGEKPEVKYQNALHFRGRFRGRQINVPEHHESEWIRRQRLQHEQRLTRDVNHRQRRDFHPHRGHHDGDRYHFYRHPNYYDHRSHHSRRNWRRTEVEDRNHQHVEPRRHQRHEHDEDRHRGQDRRGLGTRLRSEVHVPRRRGGNSSPEEGSENGYETGRSQ